MKLCICILVGLVTILQTETSLAAGHGAEPISGSYYLDQVVAVSARRYGIDPLLVHAIIRRESNYDIRAESSAGAQGLMQLMPDTQKELGVIDPWSPTENIDGGIRYFLLQLFYFRSVERALGAYNAGRAMERRGDRPIETKNYISNVIHEYIALREL